MHTIEIVLAMLVLILLSYVVHVIVKKVAVPLIQIALGAACALLPLGMALDMEIDVFMLIFIAPMLFMDGKKFKNKELLDFKKPILYLVLGLVFLNVVIVGYIIYLIMNIPLPMAFALAAILSPTDAVAVKAISGNIKLPHKVNAIVEGESMLNDASGLVAFNFALAAHMTGNFYIQDAALSFVYIAFGGLAIGVFFAFAASFIINRLKSFGIGEFGFFTLIQMLLPFLVFLGSEHLGLSGILAVVACGRTFAILAPKLMTAEEANMRFMSEGSWSTFLFTLNGLVFVLLGMKLPYITSGFIEEGFNLFIGLTYVIAISMLLVAIRFGWVYFFISGQETNRIKNALLIALSGVRGALTLAVCLSLPFIIVEGEVFQERPLILFVSSGVIIFSLIAANVFLPVIMGENKLKDPKHAIKKVLLASIKSIKEAKNSKNSETSDRLIAYFEYLLNKNIAKFNLNDNGRESLEEVLSIDLDVSKHSNIKKLLDIKILDKYELEFIAIQIQKMQIKSLLEKKELDNFDAYLLRRDISLEEAALFEDDIESVE